MILFVLQPQLIIAVVYNYNPLQASKLFAKEQHCSGRYRTGQTGALGWPGLGSKTCDEEPEEATSLLIEDRWMKGRGLTDERIS